MEVESSGDSDGSESWTLLDLNPSNKSSNQDLIEDSMHQMELSHQLDEMHRSCEMLSNTLNINGRPVIAESVLERAQSIHDIVILDSEMKNELLKDHGNISDTDSVEILHVNCKLKDLDFDTDGISVISEEEIVKDGENDNLVQRGSNEDGEVEKREGLHRRKRRKKLKLCCDSSDDFSSCSEVPQYYSSVAGAEGAPGVVCLASRGAQRRVYRHYRNNVANTVLSLTMGVFFAGVACIALGHFLGVHDAERTAGEMMEALKRLQMENVMLQARLAQLSRAFFTLESSAKAPESPTRDDSTEASEGGRLQSPEALKDLLTAVGEPATRSGNLATVEAVAQSIQARAGRLAALGADQTRSVHDLDGKITSVVRRLTKAVAAPTGDHVALVSRLAALDDRLRRRVCRSFKHMTDASDVCDKEQDNVTEKPEVKPRTKQYKPKKGMKNERRKEERPKKKTVVKGLLKGMKTLPGKVTDNIKRFYTAGKAEQRRKVEQWKHKAKGKERSGRLDLRCGGRRVNGTGHWVYRWAQGREQCRRKDIRSDWQFDRARGRKTLRDEARWYFNRQDARHHHRRGLSPDTLTWI